MRTVNIRRFSEPDALTEIAPAHLLALLEEHREFLAARGMALPPTGGPAQLDYESIARLFLSPDDIPPELVEKFHRVKQMSGQDAMDHILDAVKQRKLPFDFAPDSSPADIAAQLLAKDRALFQELHAEKAVAKYRSFTFYVASHKPASFHPPKELNALEETLNDWYERHQRGRSARVFWRKKDHETWFYIRHAEPIKREGCVGMKDNQSGSMIYRPERHDLVVYDAEAGEIRIHADCKQEPELFRRAFGQHLFNDPDFFPTSREKYTLTPLKSAQRASLACAGIDGLLAITLKEIEFLRPGEPWVREKHRADDVFTVLEHRGDTIPAEVEIRQAKFAVLFSDAKRPRIVTIKPSNYAFFGRDDDAVVVQKWLSRQGFILQNGNRDEQGIVE
jgi:hypothetical protein